eukprot:CAMPEP_0174325388 /NCGR_PEP_ID=MMETSP0810-20121108/13216_1 /TAXON_ID=73025 ORGANISM="Eutreptiella gymnastica-like, Strain CCMP1594" /NCGR_SAMPLE_ID=MMETSP0810 /ASSEMBLY_ACC=CAM_ASM_000659 /LENGTH=79 /DNA_ID=CAMNT_0015438683 /DNA_START=2508 /DNA_END=2748 /DNA_ORIENTATION=+
MGRSKRWMKAGLEGQWTHQGLKDVHMPQAAVPPKLRTITAAATKRHTKSAAWTPLMDMRLCIKGIEKNVNSVTICSPWE